MTNKYSLTLTIFIRVTNHKDPTLNIGNRFETNTLQQQYCKCDENVRMDVIKRGSSLWTIVRQCYGTGFSLNTKTN